MIICIVCVYMSLSNAKIRRSTDSVDLLNANHVSVMNPLCMQIFLLIILHECTTVHTNATTIWQHIKFQPYTNENTYMHMQYEVTEPIYNLGCVCICIHEQQLAITSNHLQPSSITCFQIHVCIHLFST